MSASISALSHTSPLSKSGKSAESGEAKSVKSAKSSGSKTSISVKIPSEQILARSPSPGYNRGYSPLLRTSPTHGGHGIHNRSLSPETRAITPHARSGTSPANHRRSHGFSPPHSLSQRSSGTHPPQATPLPVLPHLSAQELEKLIAARKIEKTWLSYRDRQMFRLLKHAVCAAEHSLSHEILRKVTPKEADFLKDKAVKTRVRFRFGGMEFPPMIYFKIYTHTGGKGVNYINGRKVIQPASQAARQACDLMGNRTFYDQIMQDAIHHRTHGITDIVDVTTLKDYMQYLNILDETPAYLGGKENSWRKLTLEVLPRSIIFYDVVDYLYSHRLSPRLREEIPTLVSRPLTQDMQVEHIRIVSQYRTPPEVPHPTPYSKFSTHSQLSGRRSKQARERAQRMKKMYEEQRQDELISARSQHIQFRDTPDLDMIEPDASDDEEEWEQEAGKLYEWTQELSFEDLVTPRMSRAGPVA